MPRSNRGDPKRPHTGDEGEQPNKRARKTTGGSDPLNDDQPSNDTVRLSDRGRYSWQSKGKWKAKSPRSKSAPASRAPSRISLDPASPSTSRQPMSAPASASAVDPPVTLPPVVTLNDLGSQPNSQELALQAEVSRLRQELENKNKVISRNENVLDTVRTSMQCGICYEPFSRPCVVVPCGHISCQNCLIEWFTSPANAEQEPHRRKRKTCPHCRGAVLSRPVELFGLAPAAAALAGQSDPSAVVPAFGPATSDADPWAKLFPANAEKPFQDDEDGVIRCPDCMHEVWGGECTHCGRVFTDESGESAYGSDDGSISVFGDGSVYRGVNIYDGSIFGAGSDEGEGDSLYGSEVEGVAEELAARIPVMYDSYEDEDDDDSFIDDAELPQVPPAAYFHHYAPSESDAAEGDSYLSAEPSSYRRSQTIRISSSESSDSDMDDSDLEEDDFLPSRGRRGRSAETETTAPMTGIETAEEADDEDEESVNPNATINLVSDDDDDAPVRPIGRARMAASWGWAAQQQPRGRSRRRIESPDLGSGSGSEYFSE
ncbi:Zinc finger, C3HC4 type (RING finger) protein [Ceratobasidium sp. AG-Ba]|nr:Zinc finger, C3HC4 type (RING finger) protein [Ceratobasidium sp. AG-Ba]